VKGKPIIDDYNPSGYDPKGRKVYQVPDGCYPLYDAVRHELQNNRANDSIATLLQDFETSLRFLESIPEDTKVGDLDTGYFAGWHPDTAKAIERACGGRKLLTEETKEAAEFACS
jgi:hypothetical protein